ncbi:hypothetical protein BC781_103518 [Sediminitomix flava]|uniref:Lysylphosphatidylglycerol synthase-like protein n=2 Tax=Sediminitomix flava TaxID=379075 RepID=A0A315Z9M6_SEDFL|nr:hypothetical protein BC781_103518 [Sediminitomix flava]
MDRFYRTLGLDLPILKHIKLYYVGMFYNLFLPGSISGDGYKIYLLRDQKTTNTKELFQATLLDRLNGSSVLTWLACVFLVFSDMAKLYTWLSVLGWLGIIFIFPIFFLFSNYLFPKFKEIFISTLIYSFAVQLLQVVCAICILKALSINSNHYDYLAFFLIGNAMTIIPISIGGVGIRELVMLYGLQFLSINKDEAVAFTLLFFTVTAITSLIGLFFTFSMSKELQNISKN